MRSIWGRFTAFGSPRAESAVTEIVSAVADAVELAIPSGRYRAFAVIGGYGRGEGGVEIVEGVEHPHNNLDFLLVLHSDFAHERNAIKQQLDEPLRLLAESQGIGIDLEIVSDQQLAKAESLVKWYDMRYGHKTILGDREYLPSLTHFRVDRIPANDVRNLLVNRGTLCLINSALLEKRELTLEERKTIIKHAIKAIIGYGDALLYFQGFYHWSYKEKQDRMAERTNVPAGFQALYAEALAFRFQPDYALYVSRDLTQWMAALYRRLEPVHLLCEAQRLGHKSLTWSQYADVAFKHVLVEDLLSAEGLTKKVMRLTGRSSDPLMSDLRTASPLTRFGCRCGGMQNALPILFPAVAYDSAEPADRERARMLLGAYDSTQRNLRRAYLQAWGYHIDTRVPTVLNRFGVSLAPIEKPPVSLLDAVLVTSRPATSSNFLHLVWFQCLNSALS
jgi:hypothetical protein